jgi:hypothetical protein
MSEKMPTPNKQDIRLRKSLSSCVTYVDQQQKIAAYRKEIIAAEREAAAEGKA